MYWLWDLRQRCTERNVPCITPATEDFLRTYIAKHKPSHILEIGSAVGYSGIVLAQAIQWRNGLVQSIEYSFPDYQLACNHAKFYNQHNITFYHGDAIRIDYKRLCWQKMDLVYIDGRKRDYVTYFQRVIDIVGTDTTVIFDDVIKFSHKTSSLYEFLDEKQIHYSVHQLDEDDGIMVIEKAGSRI